MDNLFSLTDKITRDINEETAASSISYIPSGFLKTKQAVLALATKKPKWNISILEDDSGYDVSFEKEFRVKVPREHYDDFNTKVFKVKGLNEVDLTSVLNEAAQEDIVSVIDELNHSVSAKLREQFVIENSIYLSSSWLRIFGGNSKPTSGRVLLSISNFDKDVASLMEKIKLNYQDDVGEMELAIEAIRNKTPLNDLDIFSGYDYLIAQDFVSVYEGVQMKFTCAVNMAWQPVEEIWVNDIAVVDEMSYYRKFVRPLRSTLKPVSGFFNTSLFEALKDVIDDLQ